MKHSVTFVNIFVLTENKVLSVHYSEPIATICFLLYLNTLSQLRRSYEAKWELAFTWIRDSSITVVISYGLDVRVSIRGQAGLFSWP